VDLIWDRPRGPGKQEGELCKVPVVFWILDLDTQVGDSLKLERSGDQMGSRRNGTFGKVRVRTGGTCSCQNKGRLSHSHWFSRCWMFDILVGYETSVRTRHGEWV